MILLAVEINDNVYVYGENKRMIKQITGKLYNYSNKYVAIKRLSSKLIIDIYDFEGKKICTYPNDLVDISNIIGVFG